MPRPRRSPLRASALLCAGALSLHELRYLVGWGGGAGQALADQGHAYLLTYAMPLAVGLVAAGVAQLLLRLGAARSRPSRPAPAQGWLVASAALLAIYAAQEAVEGLLDPGHPGGLAGVFGHGGVVAVPLALAIGGLIARVERGAREALATPSRLSVTRAAAASLRACTVRPSRPTPPRRPTAGSELARHLAGRAPPHLPA
jgi:hypothetical protein